MPFRMVGGNKKASRHFFAKKNGERRRTCHGVARRAKTEVFTSLCRQAQLHIFTRRQPLFTQNRRFSSLPRRNAIKPGYLHKKREALLACPAIARRATADEDVSFRYHSIALACHGVAKRRRVKLPPVGGLMCF